MQGSSSDVFCFFLFTHLDLVNKKIHNWAEFVCADHVTTVVQAVTTCKSQHIGDATKSSNKTEQASNERGYKIQICPYKN